MGKRNNNDIESRELLNGYVFLLKNSGGVQEDPADNCLNDIDYKNIIAISKRK
jgi:hypothetical protein